MALNIPNEVKINKKKPPRRGPGGNFEKMN
jgi:hypothetical protein